MKNAPIDPNRVPAMVELVYRPEQLVDSIDPDTHRKYLELLYELGFNCVSAAVGIGSHDGTDVGLLTREAKRESGRIYKSDSPEVFFAGPHPFIRSGVGIWTAA